MDLFGPIFVKNVNFFSSHPRFYSYPSFSKKKTNNIFLKKPNHAHTLGSPFFLPLFTFPRYTPLSHISPHSLTLTHAPNPHTLTSHLTCAPLMHTPQHLTLTDHTLHSPNIPAHTTNALHTKLTHTSLHSLTQLTHTPHHTCTKLTQHLHSTHYTHHLFSPDALKHAPTN